MEDANLQSQKTQVGQQSTEKHIDDLQTEVTPKRDLENSRTMDKHGNSDVSPAETAVYGQLKGVPTIEKNANQTQVTSDFCVCGYSNIEGTINCIGCKKPIKKDTITSEETKLIEGSEKLSQDQTIKDPLKEKQIETITMKENTPIAPGRTEPGKSDYQKNTQKVSLTAHPYDKNIPLQLTSETDTYELGRDVLEPNNQKISSKHAMISLVDGKWYIKDTSTHKETFLRVSEHEIQDGDEIILGNRVYKISIE